LIVKSLYLLRHAKSDWEAPYGGDHERPLNKRGKKAAFSMGEYLGINTATPDLIRCSSAKRTKETLGLLLKGSEWDVPVEFSPELYLASLESALGLIGKLPDSHNRVMMIGHQPTMGAIAMALSGGQHIDVPTCTFIHLEFDTDHWVNVRSGTAPIIDYVTPAQF